MLTVILTGGASRRMGRDKAMLPYKGKTMLQYLIDKYSPLGPVVVSVNEAGRFPFTGAAEKTDRYPGLGPLNGIVAGFEDGGEDLLFMTGTDLPFGDLALLEKLLELMGKADACIIRQGKKDFEPLFALYRPACAPVAEECLAAGRKSIREMLDKVNVRYFSPEELPGFDLEHILMNVNTMEEYSLITE